MKLKTSYKSIIIEGVCLLYVLLFVYAATSKLLDFENFQIQIGQSPLISAFASYISWFIPLLEITICLLLIVPKTRIIGLLASYFLMIMFTTYIFIILNYSSFVPCSCGGILEKLNWTQHLFFNFTFTVLAGFALYLKFFKEKNNINEKLIVRYMGSFFAITILGISIVFFLFALSEKIVHFHNNHIRRFPHTPLEKNMKLDLGVSSYYIAGTDHNKIYLGNTTAPLLITVVNEKMEIIEKKRIEIDWKKYKFRGLRISVMSPYFFITDGTVPVTYRGKVSNWKVELERPGGEYFAVAVPADSASIVIRSHSSVTGEGILGVVNVETGKTILNPALLVKQFDGVFDLDGQLNYNDKTQQIVYLYAYRNQYTLADLKLNLIKRGNTIDTISKAKLDIVKIEKSHVRKLAKPPLFVNKASAVDDHRLFVSSAIPGKFEKDALWESASIIDVYDLRDKSYRYSFCIYDIGGNKVRSFLIEGDNLYALIGSYLFHSKLSRKKMEQYEK